MWTIIFVASMYWIFRRANEIYIDDFSLVVMICLSITSMVFVRHSYRNRRDISDETKETDDVLNILDERLENERLRISTVLHDEINPNIVLSKLELKRMEGIIAQIDDANIKEGLDQSITRLTTSNDTLYKRLREVITNARFEILHSMGFTTAIEALVSNYRAAVDKPNFKIIHSLPLRPPISEEAAKIAYMVIQEALLNIIKHSHASDVCITATLNNKHLVIEIADNGTGIPKTIKMDGYGIFDMRRRLNKIGCQLDIISSVDGGTTLKFCLPKTNLPSKPGVNQD